MWTIAAPARAASNADVAICSGVTGTALLFAGVSAALFGTVPAVLIGGIGTFFVIAACIKIFPELVKVDRLDDPRT